MTRIINLRPAVTSTASALLFSASALAIASVPAVAADVLYSSQGRADVETGRRIATGEGVLQVRLGNGATLSFVDGAEFTIEGEDTVELHKGSVTVAGAGSSRTIVRMPEGVEGRVGGTGNAANFSVAEDGEASGHALTGNVAIVRGNARETFGAGEMWARGRGAGVRRVLARGSQPTPDANAGPAGREVPPVLAMREGGPAAAAMNGLPVSLGDGLAAAGASSDIVALARRVDMANGNPSLDTYPTGDLARLVSLAANLENAYGGRPFPAAQADVIRTYLRYLANGGSGAGFVTAYAGFLTQYLDLVRAGGLPSQFDAASLADIDAFLAYQSRLGALASLSAQDRVLAEAYLAFIQTGGNPDLFSARYTDLVEAYFAFVRAGNDPADFTGASQDTIDAYIAFLADSGLSGQLSQADQEILAAYLTSGGFAFASAYADALDSYFAYLAAGGVPSASGQLTPAQLQNYLELLEASGLFAQLLGSNAQFYADYLAFLRAGGSADDFGQLNANIFAGYAVDLQAYYGFLLAGGLPSSYQGDPAQLNAYLVALADAGALDAYLGANAGFFADYLAYLQAGGAVDGYAGLNANIFAGYTDALNAYYAYLAGGGLPSAYSALTQEQIAAYVAALQAQGASAGFLLGLTDFYAGYLVYLQGGGDPDIYTGLPVANLPYFADALNAYVAFLNAGGLPSDYDGATLALLATYLDALGRSGELANLLAGNADLLNAFFAYYSTGGSVDVFSGLPIYAGYVAALQSYYAFLAGGGLPADYTGLTAQQVADYLAALSAAGGFAAQLGQLSDFYTAYFAHLSAGGDPATFSGLPVYASYVSALNAYYAFLAAGGLPGDYTVLTAQQIANYLAALNAAGGFAAYADLDGFFTAYYAFIAAGGNPADYSGIPAYADYLSAIAAFYAYLANGGVPSGYTVLTAAQVQAYLQALANAGLLAANYSGDELDFYTAYLAYLVGGGVPDNFGGLPGGGTAPQLAGINAWVLGTNGLRINSTSDADIDADGRITRVTLKSTYGDQTFDYASRTADLREFGRIGNDVAWSRYYVGTSGSSANVSENLLVGTPATNLPASGKVDYDLVGGTAPTNRNGEAGSVGYFTGNLAVLFGASALVGIDFDLYSGQSGYHVQTAGGAADPSNGGMGVSANGTFENQSLGLTGINGTECTGYCLAQVFGGLFGDGAGSAGFTYNVYDQNAGNAIQGVAIFGTSGTALAGLGTMPPAADTTLTGQQVAFANLYVGDDSVSGGSVTVNGSGEIVGYQSRVQEIFTQGSTSVVESGSAAGGIYWSRWASGAPTGNYYGTTSFPALGENGGWHVITGDALTNMPASGAVAYDIVGYTTPTRSGEGSSTGSVTGSAAVVFGATSLFALDLDVTSGADQINMATDGGVADPTQSRLQIGADGVFNSSGSNPQVLTTNVAGDFCAGGCLSFVQGFLAGDGAAGAGLSYAIRQESGSPQGFINGTVAFEKGAAIDLGGGTAPVVAVRTGQVNYLGRTGNGLGNSFAGSTTYTDGAITRAELNSTSFFDIGTASVAESGDYGEMSWARWANGSVVEKSGPFSVNTTLGANGGWHLLAGERATNLPATGLVSYELLDTTAVTELNGPATGTLTGNLGVLFGAQSKVGFDFTMDYRGRTWSVETSGGAADPSGGIDLVSSNLQVGFDAVFTSTSGNVASTGEACVTYCEVQVEGVFFGDGAPFAGIGVGVEDQGSADGTIKASALALFGNPTVQSGTGGSGAGQYASNFTGTRSPIVYYSYYNGSLYGGFGGSATLENGDLTTLTSILGTISSNDADVVEAGDIGTLAWARWTNGTVTNSFGSVSTPVGANGGLHVLAGNPSTSLPASGKVDYELLATTSATSNTGDAPGTLTGALSILYGTASSVGYNFQMDVGNFSWGVSTTGGAADPSQSEITLKSANSAGPIFGGTFTSTSGTVMAGGNACQATCFVNISGALFGDNGANAVVAMNVTDASVPFGTVTASGLAIFGAQSAANTNPYANVPNSTGTEGLARLAVAPSWDRWEVANGDVSTGNGMPASAPGMDGLASRGISFSPEQMRQLEAYYAGQMSVN